MIEMFKEDALIIKSQLNAYASGRYDDEKIDKIIKEGLEEEEDFEEKKRNIIYGNGPISYGDLFTDYPPIVKNLLGKLIRKY